jgi:hypothetical protein
MLAKLYERYRKYIHLFIHLESKVLFIATCLQMSC